MLIICSVTLTSPENVSQLLESALHLVVAVWSILKAPLNRVVLHAALMAPLVCLNNILMSFLAGFTTILQGGEIATPFGGEMMKLCLYLSVHASLHNTRFGITEIRIKLKAEIFILD